MTNNGIDKKVNSNLPWQGMRKYSVLLTDNKLLLTSTSGNKPGNLLKNL